MADPDQDNQMGVSSSSSSSSSTSKQSSRVGIMEQKGSSSSSSFFSSSSSSSSSSSFSSPRSQGEKETWDLEAWLRGIGSLYEGFAQVFRRHGYEERGAVEELNDEDLDQLGIILPEHRKNLKKESKKLCQSSPVSGQFFAGCLQHSNFSSSLSSLQNLDENGSLFFSLFCFGSCWDLGEEFSPLNKKNPNEKNFSAPTSSPSPFVSTPKNAISIQERNSAPRFSSSSSVRCRRKDSSINRPTT